MFTKHVNTENSSLNENAVIRLTFKVTRIVKHEVKSPIKARPTLVQRFSIEQKGARKKGGENLAPPSAFTFSFARL